MPDLENPYKVGTQRAKIWDLLNELPFNTAVWKESIDIAVDAGFNYRTAADVVSNWKITAINNFYVPQHPEVISYYNACLSAQQATVELIALADRRLWSFRRATFRCLQEPAHANWHINININLRPYSRQCPACKKRESNAALIALPSC